MIYNSAKKFVFLMSLSLSLSFSFAAPMTANATPSLIDSSAVNCQCGELSTASEDCKKYCGEYSLNDILKVGVKATEIILALSGSVALLFFIYGGVTFLISGGSSDKISTGKQIITNSIIGIVVIFSSYIIIQYSMKAMGYNETNFGEWNQSK